MITKKVEKIIVELINKKQPSSKMWMSHITKTVKYSKILATKLNADKETCEIAAWLHDISKLEDKKDKHHITGSKRAREILQELEYDEEKIKIIESSILTHSSDKNYEPKTLEQKILASADALAFFEDFLIFVHGLIHIKKIPETKAKKIIADKVKIGWEKVCSLPEAKKLAEPRYQAIITLLDFK